MFNWWKNPSTPARVLGATSLLAVSLGIRDYVLVYFTRDGFSMFTLARYSVVLYIVAMVWVLLDRYLGQYRREQAIRHQLAQELQATTSELKAQFDLQRAMIATAAHEKERERLVHDLHDGIGLQLNTLLAMAEQSPDPSHHMLHEVRTTIDQMRMLVDNSQSFEGTFLELMGHIRHRIESRLQRAGVRLVWQVAIADTPHQVLPEKAIAVQHLMFELTTNVIKHAQATTMTVQLTTSGGASLVRLTVQDNGIGLPDSQAVAMGAGSRSIRRRVADLQGQMRRESTAGGGTVYVVELPLPTA
jgi:signal transduction histidine kinase